MGYNVHITKADHWANSNQIPIKIDDWLSYVENDPEMENTGYIEGKSTDGAIISMGNEGLCIWITKGVDNEELEIPFGYYDGRITVKNPTRKILKKMYKIAQSFEAKVEGEEGENYNELGDSDWVPPTETISKKPWWKFW